MMNIIFTVWALGLATALVLTLRRAAHAYEIRTGLLARGDEKRLKVQVEHDLSTLTRMALEGFQPSPLRSPTKFVVEHDLSIAAKNAIDDFRPRR